MWLPLRLFRLAPGFNLQDKVVLFVNQGETTHLEYQYQTRADADFPWIEEDESNRGPDGEKPRVTTPEMPES